jgi:hypothetical protein
MRAVLLGVVVTIVGGSMTAANAQERKPIPIAMINARVFMTKLAADTVTAGDLGVALTDLPGRAVGYAVGGQVFVLRRPGWAVGVGAEALRGHGKHQRAATPTTEAGPVVQQRLDGVFGLLTVDFGDLTGWSYLAAGMGPMRFQAFKDDPPGPPAAGQLTFNFGGGAQWFSTQHAAFAFDLRFFQTKGSVATQISAGRGPHRMLLMSVGVSLK